MSRIKKKSRNRSTLHNTHSDTHPVHIVNEVPEEAIEYPDVDLQKFTRQVKIGDFVVTALLDTGSVRNLIRFDVYKRMNLKTKLWRESTVLTGLGQVQVKTLGSFRHVAEIDGHVCRLDFQVVPSAALKFEAIIGSAFLAHAPCPFHEEKELTSFEINKYLNFAWFSGKEKLYENPDVHRTTLGG
ncbi:hypothetical protein TNCT_236671 [Trichonephila clavata]|uniref:Peptidase A2 domain-containing protein n=1 Tax=Trichonephila clavata TaxID=2740835 RepID=A0A8X6M5J0_TRICU|nr:hypothetical protein TNCT_236671 [Trichonephila clavata]